MRLRGLWITGGTLVAACAALVAGLSVTMHGVDRPLRDLVDALSREPTRLADARLADGLAYAPPPVQTRGAVRRAIPPDVTIAAAKLEKQAREQDTPRTSAALGVAYLALGAWDNAVESLEDAARRAPADAVYLNDLSAAYLTRAAKQGHPQDWVSGLAAAERAIAVDPHRPEPYFNRALALGGLHLDFEETEGWNAYRHVDPSGPWSAEALKRSSETEPGRGITTETPDLGPVRERIEDDLLARWGASVEQKHDADAARLLAEAGRLAEQLARDGGDTMPRDEVARIARAAAGSHEQLAALATAHRLFGEAHAQFVARNLVAAARTMSAASDGFHRAGSPYQYWSAIYDAILVQVQGHSDEALTRLEAVPPSLPSTYANLRARVAWTDALARGSLGRYDLARDVLMRALEELRPAGERDSAISMQTNLTEAEWYLGEQESAWSNLQDVLARVDDRRPTSHVQHLDLAATMAIGVGMPEAALVFQQAFIREAAASPALYAEGFLRRARTYVTLHDVPAASADLRRTLDELPPTLDAAERARLTANVAAARAELFSDGNCRQSLRQADAALAYYTRVSGTIRRADTLTVRAKCRASMGDTAGARQDLLDAARLFELRRGDIASAADRVAAFELQRRTFDDLLALEWERLHDEAAAFATAERSRAGVVAEAWHQSPDRVPDYRSLPAGTAVVYYQSLSDRVLVWVLTRERRVAFERAIGQADLARSVERMSRGIDEGANLDGLRPLSASLFDALVSPALAVADRGSAASTIVFVPSGPLFAVPFGALPDATGRALLEQRTVVIAPSLGTFLAASSRLSGFHPHSVVAVGDAHDPDSTGLPMLPHANAEAVSVGGLYPTHTVLVGHDATVSRFLATHADVVHFAGHSVLDERYPMLSRLLLAPEPSTRDSGWLLESQITPDRFAATRTVMLATCEGAAGKTVQGEGAISLARAFFAAGVPAVVASLWPVDDDVQTLATTFHRTLTTDGDPARALRAGQQALLRERGHDTPVRVWGGFIMFGGTAPSSHR